MSQKLRELIAALHSTNFVDCGGKGSQHNFKHENAVRITISGKRLHQTGAMER